MPERPERARAQNGTSAKGQSPGTIRIDEEAARSAYDAAIYRRRLIAALVTPTGETEISDVGSAVLWQHAQIEKAEQALVCAAAHFEALTSESEAAALFAIFAARAQRRNPNRKKRGRPAKSGASPFDAKVAHVVSTIQAARPGISRQKILNEFAAMFRDGSLQFDRAFPSDGPATALETISKRLVRSYEAAMKHKPPAKT